MVLMFLIGLPIAYYAARYGVDIDLLTRGAGFGYLGSTVTSLIYASFTFLLFSIEASILSVALQMLFGIPLALAHVISSLVVIPIAVYGISLISRMQLATQPIWLALQFLPIIYIACKQSGGARGLDALRRRRRQRWHGEFPAARHGRIDAAVAAAADRRAGGLPALSAARKHGGRFSWWTALLSTGPGWVLIGGFKLLAGSFLAVLALRHGIAADRRRSRRRCTSWRFAKPSARRPWRWS
jgi:hypothetical protein